MEAPTGVRAREGYPPPPVGEGDAMPPPEKNFYISSFQWCILMHSGERFRPNVITTVMFMTSAEV